MNISVAFQDLIGGNHCFGCGPDNPLGLRIKSYWQQDQYRQSICTLHPDAHHCSGPRHYLNGGILATAVDCHSVCTAIASAYQLAGREIGQGEKIWYVTGNLDVAYRKPVPIDVPVDFIARIEEEKPKKTTLSCAVYAGEQLCAESTVVAVKVSAGW